MKCFDTRLAGCFVTSVVLLLSLNHRVAFGGNRAGGDNAERAVASGWKTLFDGKTTRGWRGFRSDSFPSSCWEVANGTLHRKPGKFADCRDLVTVDSYQNFELQLEWKIEPGGNSGIKYLLDERRPSSWEQVYYEAAVDSIKREKKPGFEKAIAALKPDDYHFSAIGFELQLIDDRAPDARLTPKHMTGALYDLLPPARRPGRRRGEFNTAGIVVRGNHVEHWINGVQVLQFQIGSEELKGAIAQSKFRRLAGFGSNRSGPIDLQDHDSEIWFRKVRIRELAPQP